MRSPFYSGRQVSSRTVFASQFSCVHDFSETPKAPNCGATNSVRAPDIAFNASSGKAQVAAHVASEWQLGAVVIEVAG